jgi:glycosyltransferase involved in cell wall biosynthesis
MCGLDIGWRELEVVGGGASPALRELSERTTGVTPCGFVDDLEPRYEAARCLVAPLLSGSGIRIKIINALARGVPVVTTSTGAEGLPEQGGPALFLADRPAEFASHIDRLMTDRELWTAASRAAADYALRHFSGGAFTDWCSALRPHARTQAS